MISSWYFLSWVTWNVSCFIFSIGDDNEPTAIRSGLFKYFSEILKILFGKVAENNKVWCSLGINFKISSIWGVKPISNIRSVSSKTKYETLDKSKLCLFRWSLILPGVPTIILALFFNFLSCFCILSPPIKSALPMPISLIFNFKTVCITCAASSLVGQTIKAIAFLSKINLLIIGIVKAKVLPVPVWAVPKMSLPVKLIGIDLLWIGVGTLKSANFIEFLSLFSIGNSLKFIILVILDLLRSMLISFWNKYNECYIYW